LPVILVVDGNWYFDFVQMIMHGRQAKMASELGDAFFPPSLIVGVGYPDDEGKVSNAVRRCYDFHDRWEMSGVVGRWRRDGIKALAKTTGEPELELRTGGYDRFMALLRDELFPGLAACYPVDLSARHTLIGHSSGGLFVLRALFDPHTPFSRFVAISAGGGEEGAIERAEANYVATGKDLAADVFMCAGSNEIGGPYGAMNRFSSVMTRTAELFISRQWKSGHLEWEIMNKEDHGSIVPRAIAAGLRSVHRTHPNIPISSAEAAIATVLAHERAQLGAVTS
jgi:predicted alpha/beta superfamily hydrolase